MSWDERTTAPPEEDLLAGLNLPQRQAVMHGKGPALVLAGPGSGKTTVIVKRILFLIRQRHVPPEEILVITFTKDAALSMQQRFLCQAGGACPVNFGTFHSVFYHILLESHALGAGSTLLSQSQKISILIALLKEKSTKRQGYYDYDTLKEGAAGFLDAIGFYKNTRDPEAAAGRLPKGWRGCFTEVFGEYQRRCRAQGGIDFDDMVYECRGLLLEDEAGRAYWQRRFSYILIDEFQDINPLQYEVVKLLGEKHGNLFAVGDDDQAIYGFRGSKPACLRQFAQELHARQIILNANYRSSGGIVAAAEKVIAANRDRFAKECYAAVGSAGESAGESAGRSTGESAVGSAVGSAEGSVGESVGWTAEEPAKGAASCARGQGRDVYIRRFESRSLELTYLKEELAHVAKNCPGESCGVLFRTNGNMQALAALLAKEGIPYRMKERVANPYEHFIAKDIMAYLKLAAGDRDRELFLRVMNRPVRYLCRDSLGGAKTVDFKELRLWYGRRGRPLDGQLVEELRRLEAQLASMRKLSPVPAITYLCKAVGYEAYLREREGAGEHLEEWLEMLEFLKEDARGYEGVGEWEQAQRANAARFMQGQIGQGLGSRGREPKAEAETGVRLMTVHASKGLEFDRVYLPDCNEKVYPYGNMPDPETVEEERRIFYVGMTRAKKYLELLCITGTRERPRLMSRFLNPLLGR